MKRPAEPTKAAPSAGPKGSVALIETGLVKKVKLDLVHEKVAVPPPLNNSQTIFLGNMDEEWGDWEKSFELPSYAGVFHKIGVLNSKPIYKSQQKDLVGSPDRVSYIWGLPDHEGLYWSAEPVDVHHTPNPSWDMIGMIGWISGNFQEVWVPWDGQVASIKVSGFQAYLIEKLKSLEDKCLLLEGEKAGLQEALHPSTGLGPDGLPRIVKTGWKNKMVALCVAYMNGSWNKCDRLITKWLGCILLGVPFSPVYPNQTLLCNSHTQNYTCMHDTHMIPANG